MSLSSKLMLSNSSVAVYLGFFINWLFVLRGTKATPEILTWSIKWDYRRFPLGSRSYSCKNWLKSSLSCDLSFELGFSRWCWAPFFISALLFSGSEPQRLGIWGLDWSAGRFNHFEGCLLCGVCRGVYCQTLIFVEITESFWTEQATASLKIFEIFSKSVIPLT